MREHRRAFRDEARHPRHQRRADQIALPRDPARIGDHEQRVARASVEARRHCLGNTRRIAVAVDDPLGLSGRTRSVDEEHRIVGIDRHRLGRGPDRADEIGIRQRQKVSLAGHSKAGTPRLFQHRNQRRIGQFVAPPVALLAPDHVGLVSVAAHDHRLDARRQGN